MLLFTPSVSTSELTFIYYVYEGVCSFKLKFVNSSFLNYVLWLSETLKVLAKRLLPLIFFSHVITNHLIADVSVYNVLSFLWHCHCPCPHSYSLTSGWSKMAFLFSTIFQYILHSATWQKYCYSHIGPLHTKFQQPFAV